MRAGSRWSRKLHWERVSGPSAPWDVHGRLNPGTHDAPWQPAVLGDVSASPPGSMLCTGLGRDAARKHPQWLSHGCSVAAHQGQRNRAASRYHCGCTAPQGGTPPPAPHAALAHPGGVLHTASLLQADPPPQRDLPSRVHRLLRREEPCAHSTRTESGQKPQGARVDLLAALLHGTSAREGAAKEAPGCASIHFSCCKSSFQPRSITAAGRYLGCSRLSLSGTLNHWYCGCSCATGPFQSSTSLM